MENLIWDAVPAQRTRKTEKFAFATMTMSAIDKPGAGRKFSFNKAAQELLGIEGEDNLSFGFSADGAIIALRKATAPAGFKLTKTCTISDKRTYEFIAKRLALNIEVENNFMVVENNGMHCLELLVETSEISIMNFELGEISDEQEMAQVPSTESFGVEAAVEIVEEEDELISPFVDDLDEQLPTSSDPVGDIW